MNLEERSSTFGVSRTKMYQKLKKENLINVRSASTGRRSQRSEPPIIESSGGNRQVGTPTPTPTTGAFSNAFSNAFNI